MPYRAVLFDLDGTLLDTLEDLANAANTALTACGYPTHSVPAYRMLVGAGVRRLFERALPPGTVTLQEIERCAAVFREAYGKDWNIHTRPYDGIREMLDEVAQRGIAMTVLSNKPDDFTQTCVHEFFPDVPFTLVLGEKPGTPPKPDPTGARQIVAALGIPPEEFLYLGDTSIDMETARIAGMRPIGALWGFRSREELVGAGAEIVIARPGELLDHLESQRQP
jgi:phosphoglycolate phosphatase